MEFIDSAVSFSQSNPLLAGAIALLLIIAIYKRPKFILGIVFLALLLAGVFYLISDLSSSGTSQKQKLIQKPAP